ncbi:hypothetical protein [Aeromonas phage AS-zj]|uniref:Uncharacterized protein n=1 Tax=Aeromonas phage AS-zj TaxID=2024208 RepID=A0A223LEZ5_9CAUD|nr:hypothetical protein HWB28_gp231 [Aeromonas phage AS-zj]ASU00321.1 hypothetical protein [Aeromonas phage AS-zj]
MYIRFDIQDLLELLEMIGVGYYATETNYDTDIGFTQTNYIFDIDGHRVILTEPSFNDYVTTCEVSDVATMKYLAEENNIPFEMKDHYL